MIGFVQVTVLAPVGVQVNIIPLEYAADFSRQGSVITLLRVDLSKKNTAVLDQRKKSIVRVQLRRMRRADIPAYLRTILTLRQLMFAPQLQRIKGPVRLCQLVNLVPDRIRNTSILIAAI